MKQIVIASDRPPKELAKSKTASVRASSGLIADIQPPDLKPSRHPAKEGETSRFTSH